MQRRHPLRLISLAGALFVASLATAQAQQIFASAHGTGKSCTRTAPCSLEAAQLRERQLAVSMTTDVSVSVEAGVYRLTRPLTFTAEDSGRNGHKIQWIGEQGTTLQGSIQVLHWRPTPGHQNFWEASLPAEADGLQLFVNGKRAERARTEGCKKPACTYSETGLVGGAANLPALKHPEEAVAVFSVRWRDFHCPLHIIQGKDIVMAQPCWHNTVIDSKKNGWSNASPIGKPFQGVEWFENAFEFLGTPGQFYIDHRESRIYYTPRAGEDMRTADVELPVAEHLLIVDGTAQHSVHDLSLEGLTFAYTTWLYDRGDGYVPLQAGYLVTGHRELLPDNGEGMLRIPAAVEVFGGDSIRFLKNTLTHLGAGGIALSGTTANSAISHNAFTDISGGAVFVGDTTAHTSFEGLCRNNSVTWNTITEVAQEYRDNVAIMGGFNDGLLIAHNTVTNVPYTGISVGWGWNYEGPDDTQRNIRIQANRVSNFMLELYDGGAIYTQAQSPGSSVSENYIDFSGTTHGNGIYLDERTRKFEVCGNVVWNIKKTPPITDGQWVSTWSSWSGDLDIHDNWSDDPHTKLHNPGKTKLFHDNHLALDTSSPEAQSVLANSGANGTRDASITKCLTHGEAQ